jgi:RHS repeat-associated protein
MKPGKDLFSFILKIAAVSIILQGMFLMQSAVPSWAAPPKVICVPQLPSDLLVPHETWPGKSTILKGIARDADNNLSGGTYYWVFGDGTQSSPQSISNADNLAVTHTYTVSAGALIVARLYVTDAAGETSSDEYRILVKVKTLDVEVNKAVDDGLWWLYLTKENISGNYRWSNTGGSDYESYYANPTASAVQAFEINGHLETNDTNEDPYTNAVLRGMNYLLSILTTYNMSIQGGQNPDSNGNSIGLSVNSGRPIYETGAVMDALVASGTPNTTARTGGTNVIGRRYQDIVQDMVDMYAWGQADSGSDIGGWRYSWNVDSDNSAAQWAAIGMIAAESHFGCNVPQWVKDRNNTWLNYSDSSSGFGYEGSGSGWGTTPCGMVQLAFCGRTTSDSRWRAAENYLANHWNTFITQWGARIAYGHFAFAKAMRLALPGEVVNLTATGLDWYGDETRGLARNLVNWQQSNGSWLNYSWQGSRTSTAWAIIILNRTLFEKPPEAVITADPNPGAIGQEIRLDGSESFHKDPAKEIVEYLWDFNAANGVDFDHPDATGVEATATYGALGDYTVSLKVIDNSTPARFDVSTYAVHITVPPHPPTAVVGGPYIAAVGENINVDGSGSYDVDEGEGDSLIAWDWESDFIAPYDLNEAVGETAVLPAFTASGHKDIALRVTDNTVVAFPNSGSPNLTNVAYGGVTVYKVGVTDLSARPKATKCQLNWTHIGVNNYEILRSENGANHGYILIGSTNSTYSVFTDYNIVLKKDYWYRIRAEVNGETTLSEPAHVYSIGRIVNYPPRITTTPVTSAQEANLYQYDVNAVDPEGKALTYVLDIFPAGMTINSSTGLIAWTPTMAQIGLNEVMVRVRDAGDSSATQYYQIVVSPRPNHAPVADLNGPYSGLINRAITFDGNGTSDPDGDPITDYHWAFGDGMDGHGITLDHTYTASGLYTVTLYVTDNRGATSHSETTCQIELPNRLPTANAGGPYEGEAGLAVQFDGGQSYDPDADTLAYTWNFGDSTPAETGSQVSHSYSAEGDYQLSLSVDDGHGGLDSSVAEIHIGPVNAPPTSVFTHDGLEVSLEILTFDGRESIDPDGSIVSYEWDFGDGMTTTGPYVTHAFPAGGTFTVALTVMDNKGAEASSNAVLNISDNQPPTAILNILGNLREDGEITFSASGSTDPEGGALSYSWDFGDSATATGLEAVHIYNSPGDYTVTLTVEDHAGLSTTQTRMLSISSASGPVAVLSANGRIVVNESISFDGSESYDQSGGSIVSYVWDFGDGNSGSGSVVSHFYSHAGVYQLTLTVTDNDGLSSSGVLSLEIGANQPPQALFGYSGQMVEQGVINFNGASSYDPEGHPLTYVWDFGDGQTAAIAQPSHSYDAAGDYTVTLTVTDNMAQTGAKSRLMHIAPLSGLQAAFSISGVYLINLELTFDASASTAPPGRTIVSSEWDFGDGTTAGGVQAAHAFAHTGQFDVGLRVTDDTGAWSETHAFITISDAPNHKPSVSINAVPPLWITGNPIAFSAAGTDPDGDSLTYNWDFGDRGNAGGNSVGHAYTDLGLYTVSVTVNDSRGGTATATTQINIIPQPTENVAPVAIADGPFQVNMSEAAVFDGTGSYDFNGDALTYSWDFGDGVYGSGSAVSHAYSSSGFKTITLTVSDPDGLTGMDSIEVQVADPSDVTAPTSSLDDKDCADVTDRYTINGLVSDSNGVVYELQYREKGTTAWTTFAEGKGTDIDGELGTFDPSLVRNGIYEIRLYAEDLNGNVSTDMGCMIVDGQLKLGQVVLPVSDVNIPDQGFPLSLTRQYDSRVAQGDFGPGWSLPSSDVKPAATVEPGKEWDQQVKSGFVPTYYLIQKKRHEIMIRFSDSDVLRFKVDVNPKSSVLIPFGEHVPLTVSYTPVGDTQGSLTALDADSNVMMIDYELREYGVDLYNPTMFRLTRVDGTRYVISVNGIESMTDQYGNIVTYGSEGIYNSSGASLTFDRGLSNRIEKVTDQFGGEVEYQYDADGNLEKVIQTRTSGATNLINQYAYATGVAERPVLKDIQAPDGTKLGQFEYDSEGRMTALIDGEGNRIIYGYDLPNHVQNITDRNGKVTVYEYDNKGNVTSKLDPMGNETTWTYDANGHKLTETDPLGNTRHYTHDKYGNMLSETDPLGNSTAYTYDTGNRVLTATDARGKTITSTYDAKGNLLTTKDPMNGLITNSYDADGNLASMTDAFGNVTSYGYDAAGNMTSETDALGNTTRYTYDGYGNKLSMRVSRTSESGPVTMTTMYLYDHLNRLTREIDPDGYYTNMEYNELGKVVRSRDKNGVFTEFEYDDKGNQTLITFADGTSESYTYDGEGNKLSFTDRDNRTTSYEYDNLNRLVRTTYPDNTTTSIEYDAAGRQTATVDEKGSRTEYEYDAAGRKTAVVDALDYETSFTYDANGNQLNMTDANGHTTAFAYDSLNRRIKTTYPDLTFSETDYDALGRKISETDQAGKTTHYEYDELGRLISVTDALGAETRYAYDEVGNKIEQTDPNGNMPIWDYNNQGHVIAHTLPLGMYETFTYDANGNMLTKTDFNGNTTTYEYSPCCGRLIREIYEDESEIAFTYTGTGQRETVTDTRGTTSYIYDQRDRLLSVSNPDGTTLIYTYDPAGNRTSVAAPSGTTEYAYDVLNRLATVTDPDGGLTTYSYDNTGNRTNITYPNGNITSYEYDTLNRLTYLENRKSGGEIISFFQYTLGPSGNRTRVLENTGRIVNYTYDDVYRLVEENITDLINGSETISYTYDAFGNRLTKTNSAGTTVYTYDDNDRLILEDGPGYTNDYTYDNNGNTIDKSDGTVTTDYTYDYENRLVHLDTDMTDVAYTYDADGIRVSSNANGNITNYVVDKNRDYAQVMEEKDGSGSTIVEYVYGDDLISQERGGSDSYYLYDGQGSTRQLTNSTQTITDTYTFDAFGNELHKTGTTMNNYLYTSDQYDPNAGFYYLRARYENPKIGRFVTVDPFVGNVFQPISLHKYLYVGNNPVMNIDPAGKMYTAIDTTETLTIMNTLFLITSLAQLNIITQTQTKNYEYGDIVYRGLGPKDGSIWAIRFTGIWAKGIFDYSPSEHIADYDRTKENTGWISASHSYIKALKYARTGMATIDLDEIPGSQVFDTTKWYNKNTLTENAKEKAESDQEVLIWFHVPAYAIISVVPFK